MNDDQVKVVRKYFIDCIYKNGNDAKERLLFEKIISERDKNITNEKLSGYIYGCPPDKRYRKLKSRLIRRILEATSSDEHLDKSNLFSYREMISIRLKKQLVQCSVLGWTINKYKIELIEHLLNEVINKAAREEIYDILLEALKLKRDTVGTIRGQKIIKSLEAEIALFESCCTVIEKSYDYFFMISCFEKFGALGYNAERYGALRKMIEELNSVADRIKSHSINYFLKLFQAFQAEAEGKYKEAIARCFELNAICGINKISFSDTMIPGNLLLLARYHIMGSSYRKALDYAREAREANRMYSTNFISALEYEFYANYYLNRLDRAGEILDDLSVFLPPGEDMLVARFSFYRSCLYFRQAKYSESYKELGNAAELSKDSGGWALGLKYLQLMLQVEFKSAFSTSASVESLRKYIKRKQGLEISRRDQLIITLFRKLERNGFLFEHIDPKIEKRIEKLSSSAVEIAWNPLSYELVPVHEWAAGKIRKNIKENYSIAV